MSRIASLRAHYLWYKKRRITTQSVTRCSMHQDLGDVRFVRVISFRGRTVIVVAEAPYRVLFPSGFRSNPLWNFAWSHMTAYSAHPSTRKHTKTLEMSFKPPWIRVHTLVLFVIPPLWTWEGGGGTFCLCCCGPLPEFRIYWRQLPRYNTITCLRNKL